MQKSTKNIVIIIGILGILSGVYSIYTGGEMFDILIGIFIGASLIGSVYFDLNGNHNSENDCAE